MSFFVLSIITLLLHAVVPTSAQGQSGGKNQSIDNPTLTYAPQTSTINAGQNAWTTLSMAGAFGGSITYSNDPTATISLTFSGDAVYVWGTKKYDRGNVNVQIDSLPAESYDVYDSNNGDGTPSIGLYSKTGLSNTSHTITLSNSASDSRIQGNPWIVIDYISYTIPSATSATTSSSSSRSSSSKSTSSSSSSSAAAASHHSSNHTAVIAGATVGGIAIVLLGAIGAFFLLRKKKREPRPQEFVVHRYPDLPKDMCDVRSPPPPPSRQENLTWMSPPYTPEPPPTATETRWSQSTGNGAGVDAPYIPFEPPFQRHQQQQQQQQHPYGGLASSQERESFDSQQRQSLISSAGGYYHPSTQPHVHADAERYRY